MNGKIAGLGVMRLAGGTTLEGLFIDGLLNSTGKVTMADGRVYVGEFQDNHLCYGDKMYAR